MQQCLALNELTSVCPHSCGHTHTAFLVPSAASKHNRCVQSILINRPQHLKLIKPEVLKSAVCFDVVCCAVRCDVVCPTSANTKRTNGKKQVCSCGKNWREWMYANIISYLPPLP